jgi:hypothetical protein
MGFRQGCMRPNFLKLKRTLSWILDAAIVVAGCGLVLALLVHPRVHSRARQNGVADIHLVGQILPAPSGYTWASRHETLVLVIRKSCSFCEANFPFYKRLSNLERNNGLHAHVLVVMPDDLVSGMETLQSADLEFDRLFDQPLDALKISGTPTLLLLDARGRVTRSWVGQLNSDRQQEVISAAER